MRQFLLAAVLTCAALYAGTIVHAQQPAAPAAAPAVVPTPLPDLGPSITLDQAMKAAAAAQAEAQKNNWKMAIAITDNTGALVYYLKMDGTQYGSVSVAQDKAVSSALYRRPTTAFEAAIKAGNINVMLLKGANATPGGHPILIGGKVAGAIGVSGATAGQDDQCAKAGLAAIGS